MTLRNLEKASRAPERRQEGLSREGKGRELRLDLGGPQGRDPEEGEWGETSNQ